jgi:RNA polymerase sigma-70 factor (ECF subfamily)
MEKLDEKDREIITLRFVEELQPREIAELLGESVNAVSTRITRARQKLLNLLEYGR